MIEVPTTDPLAAADGLGIVAPEAVAPLRQWLASLVCRVEAEGVFLSEVAEMWAEFDGVSRLAEAAKLLLADKVAESGVWRRAGDRDAATYLARRSGCSVGAARRTLSTSTRLGEPRETRRAVLRGDLSGEQAAAIADAAAKNPDAEAHLLGAAARMSVAELRQECLRAKATADPDPDAKHRRIHAERRLRTRTDAEGAWRLEARGTPEDGALINLALEPIISDLFNQAEGGDEPVRRETMAFDALVELGRRELAADDSPEPAIGLPVEPGAGGAAKTAKASSGAGQDSEDDRPDGAVLPDGAGSVAGDPTGQGIADSARLNRARRQRRRRNRKFRGASTPNYTALLRLDLAALVRGQPLVGELCEIAGVGPIPVSVARSLLGESILHLVLTKGHDVANITYLGRGPNAVQRLALLWQNPSCTVEGCPCTLVDSDHRRDWRLTHHTRVDELDFLCDHHHDLKTNHGWALVPGHGKRPMVPPDDPRHPGHERTTVATLA